MFYPKDFKNRVKKAFPTWDELHRKLDSGDELVGFYLEDNLPNVFSLLDTILTATSLEELQEKTKAIQEEVELYIEWCGLYENQNPSFSIYNF